MSLKEELQHFIGTEHYYKNFFGTRFTDGVAHLAERANCFWLIDLVSSRQTKVIRVIPFQIWTLKVNPDKSCVVTMREDTGEPARVRQEIPYTDFPMDEIKLYYIDGVLLLPSEYWDQDFELDEEFYEQSEVDDIELTMEDEEE